MNQTERLYKIDRLLRGQRCVPVARFLEELGISIATFKRDLEYLRSHLNAPIEWDRACRGYRLTEAPQLGPRYELPGIWFNPSEIHALLTIEHLLKDIEPGVLHPHFSMLQEKLAAMLDKPADCTQEISRRIFVRSRFKRPTSPKHFEAVVSAVLQRQQLRIQHHSRFSNEATERTLSPQRLIHYREIWYLVAWCHLREAVRTFALDSLQSAERLDATAIEIAGSELDAILDSGYGIWDGKETIWATLLFDPITARWAASENWHPDQRASTRPDGSYQLEIPYTQDDELLMDILGYGSGCVVLAPESLRAKVIAALKEAQDQYTQK